MKIIKIIITAGAIILLAVPCSNNARITNQNMTINLNVNPHQINVSTPLQDLWDQVASSALPTEILSFLWRQRYFIAGGAVLGIYIYVCRECTRINNYLECFESWGSWHKEYSLEAFLAMPQQQIAKELVIEIQRRYSNNACPTDFIGPLISFCTMIDSEIEMVNHYLSTYSLLMRTNLYGLFPLNVAQCDELGDIIKRLQFIKNIFLAWAADYKIEHNKERVLAINLINYATT